MSVECKIVDRLIQVRHKFHFPKRIANYHHIEQACESHLQILTLQLYVLSPKLFEAPQHPLYDRDHINLYCSFDRRHPNYIRRHTDQGQRYENPHS